MAKAQELFAKLAANRAASSKEKDKAKEAGKETTGSSRRPPTKPPAQRGVVIQEPSAEVGRKRQRDPAEDRQKKKQQVEIRRGPPQEDRRGSSAATSSGSGIRASSANIQTASLVLDNYDPEATPPSSMDESAICEIMMVLSAEAASEFERQSRRMQLSQLFSRELAERSHRRAEQNAKAAADAKKVEALEKKVSDLKGQLQSALKFKDVAETAKSEKETVEAAFNKFKAEVAATKVDKKDLDQALEDLDSETERRKLAEEQLAKLQAEQEAALMEVLGPIESMSYALGRLEGQLALRRRVNRRFRDQRCGIFDLLEAPQPGFWKISPVDPILLQIAEMLNRRVPIDPDEPEEGSPEEDLGELTVISKDLPEGLPASSSILEGVTVFSVTDTASSPPATEAIVEAVPPSAEEITEEGQSIQGMPVLPSSTSADPPASVALPPQVDHSSDAPDHAQCTE